MGESPITTSILWGAKAGADAQERANAMALCAEQEAKGKVKAGACREIFSGKEPPQKKDTQLISWPTLGFLALGVFVYARFIHPEIKRK